ncbi:MAG: hypothetical protein OXC40_04650, partial [Proteobacteria bacterium]|nr:hypothetical protein [Pseudomonadota bacterium]
RDRWCINPSRQALKNNIKTLLGTYHSELARYEEALACGEQVTSVMNFVTKDNQKIKWTQDLLRYFKNKQVITFDENGLRIVHYRPFAKRYLYFAKELNWSRYRLPLLFPDPQYSNILLGVSGIGSRAGFSCFMVDQIPDLDLIPKARWFPLYYYTKAGEKKDGVNAETRQYFSYSEKAVSSEEVFYYIYGVLHSKDYRSLFAHNLLKELTRVPKVASMSDFMAFYEAGKKLADLHLNYESLDLGLLPERVNIEAGEQGNLSDKEYYRVSKKIKHVGNDNSVIKFNAHITITGIPQQAYEYTLGIGNRAPVEWVMNMTQPKVDNKTQITRDPHLYDEDPKYCYHLLLRAIILACETMKIIQELPALAVGEYPSVAKSVQ